MYIALRGRSQYVTEYEYLIYTKIIIILVPLLSNIIKSANIILLSKVGNFL